MTAKDLRIDECSLPQGRESTANLCAICASVLHLQGLHLKSILIATLVIGRRHDHILGSTGGVRPDARPHRLIDMLSVKDGTVGPLDDCRAGRNVLRRCWHIRLFISVVGLYTIGRDRDCG